MDTYMLHRGFKAVCSATESRFQNYQIRVHRSLRRFKRALELAVVYAWIAFNALYDAWDTAGGHAVRDSEARKVFLGMVLQIDKGGRIA